MPRVQVFNHRDKQNQRVISSSYIFLFATFRSLEKAHNRKRRISATILVDFWCKQRFIHNPPCALAVVIWLLGKTPDTGCQIQPQEIYESRDELSIFKSRGVPKKKRGSTYLTVFKSCWLCVFKLHETRERLINLWNFEMACLMGIWIPRYLPIVILSGSLSLLMVCSLV